MSCERALKFDRWKTFSENYISQWKFDYGLFTNLPKIIFLNDFYNSDSEEVSYLLWQNTYPNLKTTYLIKLKFFCWTKLLENLLLAKYLIYVAAPWNVFTYLLCLKESIKKKYSYCKTLKKTCVLLFKDLYYLTIILLNYRYNSKYSQIIAKIIYL